MLTTNIIFLIYGILTGLFMLVLLLIFLVNFNKKVLCKLNIDLKMLVYTCVITLIMLFMVVYLCFKFTEFDVKTYLIISSIYMIYTLVTLTTFIILLKPVRTLENITNNLAFGQRDCNIELEGAKEFASIEENLIEIRNNYREDDRKINKKDYEYQKFLPKHYLKLFGKTNIEQVEVGDSVQKDVCIMFCDVRDSFFASGTLNLQENFNIINSFLGLVGREVRKHSGFVDKFLGDGVLAIFENETDALNCANKICEKLEYGNLVTIGVSKLDFGIALHKGKVIIGIVGEKKRKSITIISEAVNLVNKVEHLNKILKTKIVFTKQILDGISENEFRYRYVGTIKFDDVEDAVPLFESLDGFKGVYKNALIKTSTLFESGVRNFEKEKYEQAKNLFLQVLKDCNDDYLSRFYLAKCNSKLLKD